MSSAPRPSPTPLVVVQDVGVDAVLVKDGGRGLLVIRPGQTFNSAVQAVQRVLPQMHPDTVRRLVREHLPHAPELMSMLVADQPSLRQRSSMRVRGVVLTWRVRVLLVIGGVLLVIGGVLAEQTVATAPGC